ncbi:hypothetical protein ASE90_07415 [Sphingomonas sp. Leaf67]|uniref:hypothetical protein n=1 Tax=Sphingomonas sp. Leaf67 TaxID=1736230 RepID=UPI0006FC60E4|nr:hypothetical protein [Sphingomonas sp. Leaf67]KQN83759.1 hypothetical protein ASE90_07415 [Sphingomonas sp. Leaf67]
MRLWLAAALVLAGCSPGAAPDRDEATLEQAAIARGVVRDPAAATPVGLYAREGDRLCIAGSRIGMFVDYGDDIGCSGHGRYSREGETLRADLGNGCTFEAAYDGGRIRLPGKLPDGCKRLCTQRASLAGFAVDRLSDSGSEAAALRDPKGRQLCGS